MILSIDHQISYFLIRKTTRAFSMLVKYRSFDKSSPVAGLMSRAYSQLFQSKQLAGLWCELCLSLLYESFMLFSSQLFGRIWFREVWGWPNGEATWQLQMFRFCICTAHQKQQALQPESLCHLGDTRQQLLMFPGELLEGSFEKIFSGNPLMLHSATIQTGAPCLPLLNFGHQAAKLKTVSLFSWKTVIQKASTQLKMFCSCYGSDVPV